MDIADLFRDPIEVWKAVEGDPTELVALLRSDKPIPAQVREALADYLAGELKPVQRPKGRPSKELTQSYILRASRAMTYGHDTTTHMGYAGYRLDHLRQYIRKKGWHRKSAGKLYWSAERLRERVAEKYGIDDLNRFVNYLNRPKAKHNPIDWDQERDALRLRLKIADEIHHKKRNPKR